MKDTTSFRTNARAEWGFSPLQMDVTVAHSGLFRSYERREDTNLQLYLTAVNLCAPMNLDKVKRSGAIITAVVKSKNSKYRDTFTATYLVLPLAVSMCRILGSDPEALIETMAVRHVDVQVDMPSRRACAAAEI